MKKPKELSSNNFYDCVQVPDGFYLADEPDITRRNFQKLIDEHNNLVEVVNMLCEKKGIVFDE